MSQSNVQVQISQTQQIDVAGGSAQASQNSAAILAQMPAGATITETTDTSGTTRRKLSNHQSFLVNVRIGAGFPLTGIQVDVDELARATGQNAADLSTQTQVESTAAEVVVTRGDLTEAAALMDTVLTERACREHSVTTKCRSVGDRRDGAAARHHSAAPSTAAASSAAKPTASNIAVPIAATAIAAHAVATTSRPAAKPAARSGFSGGYRHHRHPHRRRRSTRPHHHRRAHRHCRRHYRQHRPAAAAPPAIVSATFATRAASSLLAFATQSTERALLEVGCGYDEGRGVYHKGKCVCAMGYGGDACDLVPLCHFWDAAISMWSMEGMTTLPSTGAKTISGKGASGYVKCVSRKLPANATEVAALWALPLPPVYPPPPPYLNLTYGPDALTLLPMEANPVFLAILIILLLDVASLIFAWRLRVINYKGCLGAPTIKATEVFPDIQGADLKALGDKGGPLALMGPTGEPSDLPLLKLSLTIDAQPEEFNDRAFRMRLAGLLGIDEEMIATRTSRLKNNIGMKLDSAIKCKDAISLVNTAKMLKKPPRTLGLALGVSLIDDPSLVVPEPESMPQPEGPPLPALSVRFEIEGDFVSFDESAFLRRVTTLVGVDPSMVSASLTAGTTGSAINVTLRSNVLTR